MNIEITRRALLKNAYICALNITAISTCRSVVHAEETTIQQFPVGNQTIKSWMDQWMKTDRTAVTPLQVSRFADPIYFLLQPITWKPNPGQEHFQSVTVPRGFVTDFASIPRVFWSALRPDGRYTWPAIVHDYLYWTQTTSKEQADTIFKFGMEDLGVGTVTSTGIYEAVHLFGKQAWDKNAQLKAKGEKRILKTFPQDPATTWEQWKKRSDVFE